jgi:hypothetical protein
MHLLCFQALHCLLSLVAGSQSCCAECLQCSSFSRLRWRSASAVPHSARRCFRQQQHLGTEAAGLVLMTAFVAQITLVAVAVLCHWRTSCNRGYASALSGRKQALVYCMCWLFVVLACHAAFAQPASHADNIVEC